VVGLGQILFLGWGLFFFFLFFFFCVLGGGVSPLFPPSKASSLPELSLD